MEQSVGVSGRVRVLVYNTDLVKPADLPDSVLDLKKIGFDIPLGPWLRDELWDFTTDVLSPAGLARHGLFQTAFVQKILAEHKAGTHNHRQLLWPLIIFQFWHDHTIG